jgi:hypothetical protein
MCTHEDAAVPVVAAGAPGPTPTPQRCADDDSDDVWGDDDSSSDDAGGRDPGEAGTASRSQLHREWEARKQHFYSVSLRAAVARHLLFHTHAHTRAAYLCMH